MADKPLIEIVVERLDTVEDQIRVFVNGSPTRATIVMIDVGRGWQRSQWNSYRVRVETAELTKACQTHVGRVFDRHADSEFIEG